jgi:hypothetical protein
MDNFVKYQGENGGFSGLPIHEKSQKIQKIPKNPKIHEQFALVNEGISS